MSLPQLSPSEWPVMNVVWEHGPIRAKDVHKILQEQGHPHDVDSVKTYLARMMKKGAVSTERAGKAYLYSSIVCRETMVAEEMERTWKKVPPVMRGSFVRRVCEKASELPKDELRDIFNTFQSKMAV